MEELEARRLLSAASVLKAAVAGPPMVQITPVGKASETNVNGKGVGRLTVKCSPRPTSDLTVYYSLDGSTATAASDYAALTGSVVIPAGQSKAVIEVVPVDDALAEPAETVVVALTADAAYTIHASRYTGTVRIADNEPTVTIHTKRARTSETDPRGGQFLVARKTAGPTDLVVYYTLASAVDSATPDLDYVALAGTVVIPAGQKSALINVTPIADVDLEGNETVTVMLDEDDAYSVDQRRNEATVTITNVIAMDFVAATGFNSPGTWIFDYLMNRGETGSADLVVSQSGPDSLVQMSYYPDIGGGSETDRYAFRPVADKVRWLSLHTEGVLDATLDFTFASLYISPTILSGTWTSTSDFQVTVDHPEAHGTISGTAKVTTRLVGSKTVTVPAGTFDALVVSIKTSTMARGPVQLTTGETINISLRTSENSTFHMVPEVGIVQWLWKASASAGASGYRDAGRESMLAQLVTIL